MDRKVVVGQLKATLELPDDFGEGWDYRNVRLFASGHVYAGSYSGEELCNFATEALDRLPGLNEVTLYKGLRCAVTVEYERVEEITALQAKLQAIVDAFPPRTQPDITVRGSSYLDAVVTEQDPSDLDDEGTAPVSLRVYLATRVPMPETHPAISYEGVIDAELLPLVSGRDEAKQLTADANAA